VKHIPGLFTYYWVPYDTYQSTVRRHLKDTS